MATTGAPVDLVPGTPGTRHVALAVGLLTVGSFAPFGWVIGAVVLWSSTLWTLREKVIGTLLVPGGLGALVLVTAFTPAQTCGNGRCTGFGGSIPLPVVQVTVAIAAVASIAVPLWLYRQAQRHASRA